MSLVLGPFSPTANNPQFNDTLGRYNGAYIITNYTSYQLQFKLNTTGIQFICPPGFIRIKHKEGNINAPVEWQESLLGPLAILGTPGFFVEILQEGVDDIPPEGLIPISQIATQQPRVVAVPATPANSYTLSGNITQGAGDLVINSGIVFTWAQAAGQSARIYLYSHSVTLINGGMTAAGQLTAVLVSLFVRQLNNVNAPVGADVFLDKIVLGYYFGSALPIYSKPIGPAPATVSVIKAANAVSVELAVVVHESLIQPAASTASIFWNATADIDLRDAGLVTQVPGPGNQSYIAGASSQYSGNTW